MKYVIWTIIGFIICSILYGLYDAFKTNLKNKYGYEFYDDDIINMIIFCEATGGAGALLLFAEIAGAVSVVLLTISAITIAMVLVNNVISTAIVPGILVTILQVLFAVYTIIMISILIEQLKEIFSSETNK